MSCSIFIDTMVSKAIEDLEKSQQTCKQGRGGWIHSFSENVWPGSLLIGVELSSHGMEDSLCVCQEKLVRRQKMERTDK